MQKWLKMAYGILFLIAAVYIALSIFELKTIFNNPINSESFNALVSTLQKKINIIAIVMFMILLGIGLFIFYTTKSWVYIFFTNIAYWALTLYINVSLSKMEYQVLGLPFAQQSGYWLSVFLAVFYILGSVLVSAIGYITIRNFYHRNERLLNKASRKNSN